MNNNPSFPQGRVLKYHSNLYTVEVFEGAPDVVGQIYQCTLKGVLKKAGTDVVTGDCVSIDNVDETNRSARIVTVAERRNALPRPKIANVDRVVIVHPLREPVFDFEQLDRFMTHVALAGVEALICVSKSDLSDDAALKGRIVDCYEKQLGVPVVFTSIHEPDSLVPLKETLKGRVSVLAGLSGAGKSSLLNELNSELKIKVQEVSEKIGRGTHTTRHVELIDLGEGAIVADTPGFSNLKFNYVLPEEIEAVYPEFAGFREQCGFSNCLHLDEDGCSVASNVGGKEISEQRYASYRAMVNEAALYKSELKSTSQKEELGQKTMHTKGKGGQKQILRLKSKARQGSRRTLKQQMSEMVPEDQDDWRDGESE